MKIYLHDKEISAFETTEDAIAAIIQELNSNKLSTGWWSFYDAKIGITTVNNFSRTMRRMGASPDKYPRYIGNGIFTTNLQKGVNQ